MIPHHPASTPRTFRHSDRSRSASDGVAEEPAVRSSIPARCILVILSEARGFASRIRTRSRRIPAPSSAFCRPQGVLPVSGGKIGKGTSFTRANHRPTRNAASAAEVRTQKTLCHSDRSRSASDGAAEEPAVRFPLRYSINFVILSEARGFASRIRTRSRRIPALLTDSNHRTSRPDPSEGYNYGLY